MPQETKAHPDTNKETLQGWIPALASEQELRDALDKAFDYRGDISITKKSGEKVEGYLFDRRSETPDLSKCVVRLMPKDRDEKINISYTDIARLEFSGKDTAAGKSFETWLKKWKEKKAAGEKNIGIESEPLD